MARPHHGVRHTTYPLPGRNTLEDTSETLADLRGFLEPRIEATARVASILISSAGKRARRSLSPVPPRGSSTPRARATAGSAMQLRPRFLLQSAGGRMGR